MAWRRRGAGPILIVMRTAARPIRVLIVEDEGDIADVLSLRLRAAKTFEVASAASGREGIHLIPKFRPDVLLLDLVMPGLDGWDVCRALRADPATADLPVVMMTAFWAADTEAKARAFGIKRILFKPLDLAKLVESLNDAVKS